MNEAILHTVAMLTSAVVALALGYWVDVSIPDVVINVALAAMLYFVFVCIDGRQLKDSFRNMRFTATEVILNFVWAPVFAFGLGYLFFSDNPDIRIGLLLALSAPCTDWYLVFTASAKGDLPISSSILPLNMILQIILVPVYLMLFFSSNVSIGSFEPVILALLSVFVPMLVALMVRHISRYNERCRHVMQTSVDNASLGQIVFLCIAVFVMFLNCSKEIVDNSKVVVECLAPFLVFFVLTYCISHLVSRGLKWSYDRSTSLIITTLARNSPLILAMMSPIFQNQPLVLVVLVICPLIELPFLSVVSSLRLRFRPA